MTTLEQRLRTALPRGQNLVTITHKGRERRALVTIRPRGSVWILFKPDDDDDDMYTSARRVEGDTATKYGTVVVWAARNPEYVQQFDGEPAASIALKD